MKLRILFASLLSLAILFSFGACEGDIGPQGPAGTAGSQGPVGPEGPVGQNGAENCVDCHGNNQLITAKTFQWENSIHALGGHYERNAASCAVCHTSQGFREVAGTGMMSTAGTINDPLPQNCYTCHMIHETYTEDDWGLTTTTPVTFWVGGETVDLGKGNLCINCHQARVREPLLAEPGVNDTERVSVTSSRYGPHHGAQGVLLTGSSAYKVPGSLPYENSTHASIENACVNCHMATATGGRDAGGHTFRVESEDGNLNTNGCGPCHTDSEANALVMATQSEIDDLLNQLGTRLNGLGILADNLESVNASNSNPLELTNVQLGVLWNYQYVREDKSGGVHNGKYARALLQNSLEALN